MTNTATPASIHRNVVPSEVGWQFVPQYYTFVNKQPDRLHCFYTKKSTFIHGTEGEDVNPCHGQQEIHEKITSIGFQDCKVFIHSVDAQSSADGGIIIQVIGEMSNHNDPWRKFVQTFFLAEQPNGYFVLNDIFRFLKEETVDSDEASETAEVEPQASNASPAPSAPEPIAPVSIPAPVEVERERTPSPVPAAVSPPAPTPAEIPAEEPTTVSEVAEPSPQVATPAPEAQLPSTTSTRPNGIHAHEPEKQLTPAAAAPAPTTPAVPIEKSKSPAPRTPAAAPTPPPAAAAAQPAAPPAPAAPKTWANLAATNSKKWGAAVAQESRGTSEVVPPTTASGTQTPSGNAGSSNGPHVGAGGRPPHPAFVAAQSTATPLCFVKGVTEVVSQNALTSALVARFGPLKESEIIRSKACAFIEFVNLESAKRAIVASLPQSQGGEGGLWIDVGGEVGNVRITVETRKEKGERPVSRPRGGAPPTGEPRGGGSFRGRGGGRGRGAAPGK